MWFKLSLLLFLIFCSCNVPSKNLQKSLNQNVDGYGLMDDSSSKPNNNDENQNGYIFDSGNFGSNEKHLYELIDGGYDSNDVQAIMDDYASVNQKQKLGRFRREDYHNTTQMPTEDFYEWNIGWILMCIALSIFICSCVGGCIAWCVLYSKRQDR
uniref:Uncharacterized protein n=1 Tax=Panagrolaimus sp. PS1159 TaxID=55785 RepID=A0AC35GDI9_9BILA